MDALVQFISCLTPPQKQLFTGLTTPALIQEYLDSIPYRVEDDNCCALSVFRDGKAHCFDGSLFAALALRQLGYQPSLVQLLPENDDDHMLTLYRRNGRLGALAKSNYAGLRSREPVYTSLRELVMSYFHDFYNLDRQFTLRGYSLPVRLEPYDRQEWATSDAGAQVIVRRLYTIRKMRLFPPEVVAALPLIDATSYQAGMTITNLDGAFKPGVSPDKKYGF